MTATIAIPIIIAVLAIVALSLVLTRVVVAKRNRDAMRMRLESMIALPEQKEEQSLVKENKAHFELPFLAELERLHQLAGFKSDFSQTLQIVLFGTAIIACLPFALDLPAAPCLVLALMLPVIAFVVLKYKAEAGRTKFQMQLPNALDLMVSILRSGHSIPMAVRSVAQESPAPLGDEFIIIFHRMNLGQSLPEALETSVKKYDSFELDLLRRASALNLEVGGSLAEVLDKTNHTLRERINLKNQIGVLTAQGKLSAIICGMLPIVVAVIFSQINPNYLEPLTQNITGQIMIAAAVGLELVGFFAMYKLSSFRI